MSRSIFMTVGIALLFLSAITWCIAVEDEKPVHVVAFPEIRWSIPETITFTVVDEADQPLAGIKASFSITDLSKENDGSPGNRYDRLEMSDLVTDANGNIVIEIPPEKRDNPPVGMSFSVPVQGLLMSADKGWSTSSADNSGLVTVPNEAKITLIEGKMFRLYVVDEAGNPIEGAQVGDNIGFPFRIPDYSPKRFTDENGVYLRGPVPRDFNERRLMYDRKIYHPDFVRWPIGARQSPGTPAQFSENIIDEYTVTLKRGRTIGGIVLDANGQPVPEADLFVGGQNDGAEKEG